MSAVLFRKKDYACVHPETYKYFLEASETERIWREIAAHIGPLKRNSSLGTLEVCGKHLWFRATAKGNPITVIRRRGCLAEHVRWFHELIGFQDPNGFAADEVHAAKGV